MEVHYLAIVLAKSFIAAGDKEEILLLVKVIAKAKKASPDNAGLSCRAICRYVGRRKIAVSRVFTILTMPFLMPKQQRQSTEGIQCTQFQTVCSTSECENGGLSVDYYEPVCTI